ncbi:carbohydrate esterase family 4 protein [Mycena galericulata]|nr:carbohydrate esterase family 4 protein [Mycena galericulata]
MLGLTLFLLPLLSAALVHRTDDHDHSHSAAKRLPSTWYHPDDHPVHKLFKRGAAATDGATYATVGSDEWTNAYPAGPPTLIDGNAIPAEWAAALAAAVASGTIPDVPVSSALPNQSPTYPGGVDPSGSDICSGTYGCRIPGDIWDAPDGYVGLSFDDGPLPPTDGLMAFLESQNQIVTHFQIGSNIIWYPEEFQKVYNLGHDICVHTWTHPLMTTQSNLQVVGELGWTMELIHNSTGGRIPKFWRPPYGDTDKRVSAIAKEVFGLTTIVWNQDTADWTLTEATGGTTPAAINASMTKWLTGSKSPGLIILEHELSNASVDAFIAAYPVMQQNKWNLVSLAQLVGDNVTYQNADTSTSAVTPIADILDAKNGTASSSAGPSGTAGTESKTEKLGAQATSAGASSPSASPSSTQGTSSASRMGPAVAVAALLPLLLMLWA